MKFTIAREIEFIPKWNGNDKSDEPIKFTLKYLNSIERDAVMGLSFDQEGKVQIKPDHLKACRLGIKKIDSLNVDGPIISAEPFLKLPGFYELFLEVGGQIISMNPLPDLKN